MSFRFLTAGESHGKALVGILEGIPAGIEISEEYIQKQLIRRKHGYGRGGRQKIESDEVEILSGVRLSKTLGSPICLLIKNRDWQAWKDIMSILPQEEVTKVVHVPRPGHADLPGGVKYNHEDMRNVLERSSARETAIRVALGSIARKFLEDLNIHIVSRVIRIGTATDSEGVTTDSEGAATDSEVPGIFGGAGAASDCERAGFLDSIRKMNDRADASPVRCLSAKAAQEMIQEVDRAKKEGDTLGGEFEVYAVGVPVGLGSYVQWDRRLEGKLSQSLMSLNAIKGIEVGLGFEAASLSGAKVHDEIAVGLSKRVRYLSNRSGGIEGGISTGQPIVVRAAMKPLATLMRPLRSVDMKTGQECLAHIERSDVCAVPSAAVIGESIVALVIAEAILEKFGGDSFPEVQERVTQWRRTVPVE